MCEWGEEELDQYNQYNVQYTTFNYDLSNKHKIEFMYVMYFCQCQDKWTL